MNLPTVKGPPGSERQEDGGRAHAVTPADARRSVGALLARVGISLDSILAADALMVTTELVTNALRHGGGLTLFRIAVIGRALHLSVGDASTAPPVTRPYRPGRSGGYGWPLIQRLTHRLTVRLHPDGKIIKAVLPLT
ncbi:ATP-binding protein [Streptomyces virginiae]|uniref:ATP-binding protein n=1 Tax=Streptomyces virginiae TaxID=1961 RepID=UPI003809844E